MINITFKPETLELEIKGHAGQNEKGKDIVCSAISTLFYTLARSVVESGNMLTKKPIIKNKDGNGYIKCSPKKEYAGNIARSFWTILIGFEMVANEYKDFVTLDIWGGNPHN
jgi:uncharacterized protein YsxB (DUF464 family)